MLRMRARIGRDPCAVATAGQRLIGALGAVFRGTARFARHSRTAPFGAIGSAGLPAVPGAAARDSAALMMHAGLAPLF